MLPVVSAGMMASPVFSESLCDILMDFNFDLTLESTAVGDKIFVVATSTGMVDVTLG